MEKIRGVIGVILFENEENGYKICILDCDGKNVTARGILPYVHPGETIEAEGRWQESDEYGPQFMIESYDTFMPENQEDIVTFLQSDLFAGIGEVTAIAIVEKFGGDTIDIIKNHPEEIATIKGISEKKAQSISDTYNEYSQLYETFRFCARFGIKMSSASAIYSKFGPDSVDVITDDPYILTEKISGFTFAEADKIAMSLDIPYNSAKRINAGILWQLDLIVSDGGHLFYPYSELVLIAAGQLGVNEDEVENCLEILSKEQKIVIETVEPYGKVVYQQRIYEFERFVKSKFDKLSDESFPFERNFFEDAIDSFEKSENITMGDMQKEAVEMAGTKGLLVITGGPGTGKTTIIKAVTRYFDMLGLKTVLTAPTGRAAKRITESCGKEARTIHRLLEVKYNPEEDESRELKFKKNANDPLDADVIIADETSMIDIILMYHLLQAMKFGARLILVGDKDQLPSVGPGKILADLISDEKYPRVVLDEIYRQSSESLISLNAYKINHGQLPELNDREKDFFFIPCRTADECARFVTDLCCERLPKAYGFEPVRDIQVITPTKQGPCGTKALNRDLQSKLNPKDIFKKEKKFSDQLFREGDRVMHIRNDYELEWERTDDALSGGVGVFNGEMGIIQDIQPKTSRFIVEFDDERYSVYNSKNINEIELCYAITVHKSQGSEFDCVVIPLFNVPYMLMSRNILYTAITRAKKFVVIVGDRNTMKRMIANNRVQFRYTNMGVKEAPAAIDKFGYEMLEEQGDAYDFE